jgi:two-component system, chemotaxis family, chemotaxis protein CheY
MHTERNTACNLALSGLNSYRLHPFLSKTHPVLIVPLDFSRLQLLLVDDNDFMRDLYRQLLEAIGFDGTNITEAADGSQALTLLQHRPIDIVICDLNMKPMNGKRFTRYIRMNENTPDPYLPIIVCTGHAELIHIAHARDAGANEILRKPVSAASLYARLQSVIETPRPFILSPNFIGPDRRRQDLPFDGPDRRTQTIDL